MQRKFAECGCLVGVALGTRAAIWQRSNALKQSCGSDWPCMGKTAGSAARSSAHRFALVHTFTFTASHAPSLNTNLHF